MTLSRTLKRRAKLAALTLIAACSTESVLEVQDPDVINPDQITTAGGAEALRRGALSRFINATSGGESFFLLGGLLADEYRSGDTFTERNETDRRTVQTSNAQVRAAFRLAYRARISAQQSVAVLRQFEADPYKIGEMYLVMAYIENLLAEDACSGLP
jgi:starch-binding outer membrane protein, SusD/RagB family